MIYGQSNFWQVGLPKKNIMSDLSDRKFVSSRIPVYPPKFNIGPEKLPSQ